MDFSSAANCLRFGLFGDEVVYILQIEEGTAMDAHKMEGGQYFI